MKGYSQIGNNLEGLGAVKLNTAMVEDLVDINDVSVDKALPDNERVVEYVRQIKNPRHFKCGKFTIHARFDENSPSLADRLQSMASL